MDLAAAFYAAVAEVADGKVAEIEVERTFVDDEETGQTNPETPNTANRQGPAQHKHR